MRSVIVRHEFIQSQRSICCCLFNDEYKQTPTHDHISTLSTGICLNVACVPTCLRASHCVSARLCLYTMYIRAYFIAALSILVLVSTEIAQYVWLSMCVCLYDFKIVFFSLFVHVLCFFFVHLQYYNLSRLYFIWICILFLFISNFICEQKREGNHHNSLHTVVQSELLRNFE